MLKICLSGLTKTGRLLLAATWIDFNTLKASRADTLKKSEHKFSLLLNLERYNQSSSTMWYTSMTEYWPTTQPQQPPETNSHETKNLSMKWPIYPWWSCLTLLTNSTALHDPLSGKVSVWLRTNYFTFSPTFFFLIFLSILICRIISVFTLQALVRRIWVHMWDKWNQRWPFCPRNWGLHRRREFKV